MTSQGVLDYRLVPNIINSTNVYCTLDSILSTIECMTNNFTPILYANELFYQKCGGTEFVNWLYDANANPELRDIKKELSIQISKAECIDESDYTTYLKTIDALDGSSGLAMSICCEGKNVLYVSTPDQYWEARQWFLAGYISHNDFVSEASRCFPNLFFHNNVISSFNTLNGPYLTERPIIVNHLKALNSFQPQCRELCRIGIGYRELSAKFEEEYSIECSPQASRDSTQNLLFKFYNEKDETDESLCCELHTKLKWHGMDKVNQDRIYFHPGKNEIEAGKILVAHIGSHQ